jgi:DNA-binding LacI/PurR family transcriptional regulator
LALGDQYWEKTIDYLASRGRKRIAVITTAATRLDLETLARQLQPLLASRRMKLHPYGLMPVGLMEGAGVYLRALMQSRKEQPPDGLMIADDNLVEHAWAGLIAAGVRVGVELDIVARCNLPWAGSSVVPVKRLGYDTRAVLQTCIELIDRQRRGESVPPVTTIVAKFEEELEIGKLAVELVPPR